MKLIDIINGPWVISSEMLGEIQEIYRAHVRGPKIDVAAIEASLGRPLNNETKGYKVMDGAAIVPVDGVIGKKMNLFSQISGGCSTDVLQKNVSEALADPSVKGIILAIDSPGGTVTGTSEAARFIREARGKKPIYTWSDGCMCSGAAWIGTAADGVYISSGTVTTGSIGVLAKHIDTSGAEEKAGLKTTEITAGRYKRIAGQYGPLSDEGRADMQSRVDAVYSEFVNDVAANRGCTAEEVLVHMADGREFVGRQAIEAGLVDGIATLGEVIAMIHQTKAPAGVARAANQKGKIMTLEQLRNGHPDLVAAITAEATEGMIAAADLQNQIATARAEGAEAERQRIADVRACSLPGHEALIATLAADGKTTGPQAAMVIIAEEKKRTGSAAANIAADAPPVVPPVADGDDGKKLKRRDFDAMTPAAQAAFVRSGGQVVA
jgi:signal peptide peptidase SppA